MIPMSRLRRAGGLTIWAMVLILLLANSCSRPAGLHGSDNQAEVEQHQIPFHEGDASPTTGAGDSSAARDNAPNAPTGLPFRDSRNLPVGTLLTVRLRDSISAENPGARGTFNAVIDNPVVIEGDILVPRGATVAGRVESARASKVKRNRGYVRLALDSVQLSGAELPIQTSSLFVRGNTADAQALQSQSSPAVINLEKGRRLTFRLTESVYLPSQRALSSH
jgi:hypothetical protein